MPFVIQVRFRICLNHQQNSPHIGGIFRVPVHKALLIIGISKRLPNSRRIDEDHCLDSTFHEASQNLQRTRRDSIRSYGIPRLRFRGQHEVRCRSQPYCSEFRLTHARSISMRVVINDRFALHSFVWKLDENILNGFECPFPPNGR